LQTGMGHIGGMIRKRPWPGAKCEKASSDPRDIAGFDLLCEMCYTVQWIVGVAAGYIRAHFKAMPVND